ncbi:MAG: ParA family protein [Symploca sp. SIO3C6]|nr:ParA family protein [Symploca sp. SIO3C6]
MEKIIAIFNQAGGVGKSTLTHNLGYELHQRGRRVLLIDMDPQGSLTDFSGIESADVEITISLPILDRQDTPQVETAIVKTAMGIDLIPASSVLAENELAINGLWARETQLKRVLSGVLALYDYILLDCPPSLGIFSVMSLVAATDVLIPVETQYKALKGTKIALKIVRRVQNAFNENLQIFGFVPTIYDSRRSMDKRSLKIMKDDLPQFGPVLEVVPSATAFTEASSIHEPLENYSPRHLALKPLQRLVDHIEGRVVDISGNGAETLMIGNEKKLVAQN